MHHLLCIKRLNAAQVIQYVVPARQIDNDTHFCRGAQLGLHHCSQTRRNFEPGHHTQNAQPLEEPVSTYGTTVAAIESPTEHFAKDKSRSACKFIQYCGDVPKKRDKRSAISPSQRAPWRRRTIRERGISRRFAKVGALRPISAIKSVRCSPTVWVGALILRVDMFLPSLAFSFQWSTIVNKANLACVIALKSEDEAVGHID